MCVDDDKVLLKSLKEEIVGMFGYEYRIEIVDDPNDALEFIAELIEENYEISIVIADYIMPGMYGDKLLKEIHKVSPQTFNVLLSGQATINGVVNAINHARLYKYLNKPWDKEELRNTIDEASKLSKEKRANEEEKKLLVYRNCILEDELNNKNQEIEKLDMLNCEYRKKIMKQLNEKLEKLKDICEPISDIRSSIDQLIEGISRSIDEEKEKVLFEKSIDGIEKIICKIKDDENNFIKEDE